MDNNLYNIGQRIRDERNNHKWLINELSERTGLSVAHISSIERGKCNFSIESLIKIADALDVSVNYLLFGIEPLISTIPDKFQEIICDCNQYEIRIIVENAKYLKEVLRKNNI